MIYFVPKNNGTGIETGRRSKAETGMTMSTPDFLINAYMCVHVHACRYHFYKIMTYNHVAINLL